MNSRCIDTAMLEAASRAKTTTSKKAQGHGVKVTPADCRHLRVVSHRLLKLSLLEIILNWEIKVHTASNINSPSAVSLSMTVSLYSLSPVLQHR